MSRSRKLGSSAPVLVSDESLFVILKPNIVNCTGKKQMRSALAKTRQSIRRIQQGNLWLVGWVSFLLCARGAPAVQ